MNRFKGQYKILFVITIVLVAMSVIVACGSGSDQASSNQNNGKGETTTNSNNSGNTENKESKSEPVKDDFPTKPITIIVPFSAGGGFDTVSRQMSKYMSEELGVPVQVKNVPGGGQQIGAVEFQRSEPDGYTIGYFADSGLYISQITADEPPRFDVPSWDWAASVRGTVRAIAVPKDSPFKTLEDVLTTDTTLRIPDIGPGSGYFPLHVVFSESLGLDTKIISGYGGTSEMIPALLRGEGDIVVCSPITSCMKWVESGDLRFLAILDKERMSYLPDVPAITEIKGVPSLDLLDISDVYGMSVPPGTPKNRTEIIGDAITKTLQNEEFLAWAEEANVKQDLLITPLDEFREQKAKIYKTYSSYKDKVKERIAASGK
jgi:tripartite-type tricarboxylate transporter receptor subunit TctC